MASTIYDVAKYTGLSVGTISKYINEKSVKEVNRVKIEKAIRVLNYVPNNIAKGLRKSTTFTVAVLCPMLTSIYCTTLISTIERYLLPLGYGVIVCECFDDAEMELQKAEFLVQRKVDGVILLPYSPKGKQFEYFRSKGIPVVVVDQMIVNHEADSILLDNETAMFLPTEAVIAQGHKDIALLTGNPALFTAEHRIAGYLKAFEKHGLPIQEEYIVNGNYTTTGGYQAFMKLYQLPRRPTAVLCSNYDMTLGAILAIHNIHLRIPEDISLVGFDNLTLSEIVDPPLCTIEQPMEAMGISAAELLYKRIQGDFSNYPQSLVHTPRYLHKKSIKTLL